METKKDEVKLVTSNPDEMLYKYLSKRVMKTWKEDFIDKDTGKVEQIERSSVLFEKGTYVDPDILSQICFFIEEGSVTEVEVSNQKRMSFVVSNTSLFPYKVVVNIDDKKHPYLLYASSVQNAIDIVTDFVELNSNGGFYLTDVKELDNFVVIVDRFVKLSGEEPTEAPEDLSSEEAMAEYLNSVSLEMEESEEEVDKSKLKFYQILSRVVRTDEKGNEDESQHTFMVHTYNCTRANLLIEKYLRDKQEEHYKESLEKPFYFEKKEINSFVEESKIVRFDNFIPTEFSMAYQEEAVAR
ncbi:MAG: RNA polymerase subunit sigma [Bacteroides sp.]|nr:RNA polymerase subunit sigma [Bacteroides sp.]